jgi:hypothetical protein
MWLFLKRVAKKRIGHSLLVVNLCILAYGYSQSASLDGCTPISEVHQPSAGILLLNAVATDALLVDLPSVLLSTPLVFILMHMFPNLCVHTVSRVGVLILLVFSSGQWMLIGYSIEALSKIFRK